MIKKYSLLLFTFFSIVSLTAYAGLHDHKAVESCENLIEETKQDIEELELELETAQGETIKRLSHKLMLARISLSQQEEKLEQILNMAETDDSQATLSLRSSGFDQSNTELYEEMIEENKKDIAQIKAEMTTVTDGEKQERLRKKLILAEKALAQKESELASLLSASNNDDL